jgi:hypothetical protein
VQRTSALALALDPALVQGAERSDRQHPRVAAVFGFLGGPALFQLAAFAAAREVTDRGRKEADDDHRRAGEAAEVAAQGLAEAAQNAQRQRAAGVGALGFEAGVAADQTGEYGLRAALAAAARGEVIAAAAGGGDEVVDRRSRVVDDLRVGPALADADAEVGLLAAGGDRADASQLVAETAELDQHLAAQRHVGADQVAHGLALLRHAGVGAADHPVELGRKPGGLALVPGGVDGAAGAEHVGVAVGVGQALQPVGGGKGVVVEEGDDITAAGGDAAVAGAGEALFLVVLDQLDLGPAPFGLGQQLGRVVDRQHDLVRGQRLRLDRFDRLREYVEPVERVGADQHRDGRRPGLDLMLRRGRHGAILARAHGRYDRRDRCGS